MGSRSVGVVTLFRSRSVELDLAKVMTPPGESVTSSDGYSLPHKRFRDFYRVNASVT